MNLHDDKSYLYAEMDPATSPEDEGLFVTADLGSVPTMTVMLDFALLDELVAEMDKRRVGDGFGLTLPLDSVIATFIDSATCPTGEIDEAYAQAWSCLLRCYADQIDAMPRIPT